MGRSDNGMITSLTFKTKIPNNKQKTRTSITDITNQYFQNLIKEFNNSPYLGYKKKQVHNEPTEAYLIYYYYLQNSLLTLCLFYEEIVVSV